MNDKDSCIGILAQILRKIDNLPDDSFFWVHDLLEKKYSFPIFLDAGNGQGIYITPEINEMLARFSEVIMDVFFPSYKSNFRDSEWNRIVKRALGTTLINYCEKIKFEDEKKAETILKIVEQTIHNWIYDIQEHEYVFGCHICNISDLEPLSIGSVRFEPKFVWLEKMQNNGSVSKVSRSRMEKAWQGKKLRRRNPSGDEFRESLIFDALGKCDFVCSVDVGPMGSEAGLQKALIAARLAITAIALAWAKPSSILEVMTLTFDRQPYVKRNLVFSPCRSIAGQNSWSYLPGGVFWLNADEWEKLLSDSRKLLNCVGETIQYVTHGPNKVEQPKIMEVLFQALLWFHEGCKEDVDPMAIVKFCSSMEALVYEKRLKGIKGILKLMKTHLCIEDEDKLYEEVKKLYGAGRSQTVHGKNDRLGHDWSNYRNLSEHLARMCLVSCLQRVADHRGQDDPKFFLRSR